MSSNKMIVLKSSDGESFQVEEAIANQSQTIAHLIEDDCVKDGVPLSNVTGQILAMVIEYCKKHAEVATEGAEEAHKEELKKWDAQFVKMDKDIIIDIILAANYLNIPELLDLTCQTIADKIVECKTPENIRKEFGIKNDFTPEEEEKVRKDNQWAFE